MQRPFRCLTVGVLALALSASGALAQDETRVKLAAQLLDLVNSRKLVEQQMDAVMKAQVEAANAMVRKSGAPDDEMKKIEPLQAAIRDLLLKELDWDAVRRDMSVIYASVFTEDELRDMITFFDSPAGRAWIEKTPEITGRLMQIMQTRMITVMPKLLELLRKRMP